jgi:hypothetical protein
MKCSRCGHGKFDHDGPGYSCRVTLRVRGEKLHCSCRGYVSDPRIKQDKQWEDPNRE